MSKRRTRGRTTGTSSWYCVATRATTTPPPLSGQAAGAAARWVWSTRAGGRRHACRPYSAPGRRPGRPPRPWGRSLAKGAACRNPARRAASSCFLRRSLRRFHRSRSRSTPVNSSRSRSISRSCSRMRESRNPAWSEDVAAAPRSYATPLKIVQVQIFGSGRIRKLPR